MKKFYVLFIFLLFAFANLKAAEIDTVWMRATPIDIYSVSFHPNNKIFATGTGNHVGIWDVATATETRMYEGISSGNSFFSKTGKYLIHSFQIDNEEGYNISTFPKDSLVFTFKHNMNSSFFKVTISSDEKYFAVTYNDVFLQIWDIQTGKKIKQYDSLIKPIYDKVHPDNAGMRQIEFSPDGTKIAFIGEQGVNTNYNIKLYILDLVKDSIIYSTQIGEQGVIKYSNDGTKIAFTSPNKNEAINIMDLNTKQIVAKVDGLSQAVNSLEFSLDDKYLIISQYSGKSNTSINVYSLESHNIIKQYFTIPSGYALDNGKISNNKYYILGNSGAYLFLYNFQNPNSVIETPIKPIASYPNPTNGYVTINTNCISSQVQYTISNQLGQVLSTNIIQNINNQIKLNFSQYPSGVYFIDIEGIVYKLIKE